MLLRLTTPEAFNQLIAYLETAHNLQWPSHSFSDGTTYRDYIINSIREELSRDTVLLEVDWTFDSQIGAVVTRARSILLGGITTDADYLNQKSSGE